MNLKKPKFPQLLPYPLTSDILQPIHQWIYFLQSNAQTFD